MFRSALALLVLASVPAAWGQLAISAKSGMIHHSEGTVALNGQQVKLKFGQFPEIPSGGTLSTRNGRAEILLNPGVFLRLDRDSEMRMLSNRLTDSQVELIHGRALIEVQELSKEQPVTIHIGETLVRPESRGLYRIDATEGLIRVYEGKARVSAGPQSVSLKKGREVALTGTLTVASFNPKETQDSLHNWSSQRAAVLARANFVAARTAMNTGYRSTSNGWALLPTLGMYTYLPRAGSVYSPFGYYFVSPVYLYNAYNAPVFGNPNRADASSASAPAWSGLGNASAMRGSVSYSGAAGAASSGDVGRSAPAAAAPAAATAPAGRSR